MGVPELLTNPVDVCFWLYGGNMVKNFRSDIVKIPSGEIKKIKSAVGVTGK